MIHRVLVRDLNTLGNLLPKDSLIKKSIHYLVLSAVEKKKMYVELDDTNKAQAFLLKGIPLAKTEEKKNNFRKKFHSKGI